MENVRKAAVLAILDGLKSSGRLRTANMILADMKQLFRRVLASQGERATHRPCRSCAPARPARRWLAAAPSSS